METQRDRASALARVILGPDLRGLLPETIDLIEAALKDHGLGVAIRLQESMRRPIALRRLGDYVIVEIEENGQWREVIRERHEGYFSHIWEDNT